MVVLLVRHAVAVSRRSWTEDDALRPLNERGGRQAAALVGELKTFDVVRVLASPTVRCVATVEPLAVARGLDVVNEDDLFEGEGPRALALIRSMLTAPGGGQAVVLCSHGDVIPECLDVLAREGADLGDGGRCQKGSVWALRRDRDGRTTGCYTPPAA